MVSDMASSKIKNFFNDRWFLIPRYQRSYAWEKANVRELFSDIFEAIEAQSSHYAGTIVLSKTGKEDLYYVVDGQQRITTLIMIINVLIQYLPERGGYYYHRFYIKDDNYRLKPLERDRDFFVGLLEDGDLCPQNKGQKSLLEAYEEIKETVKRIESAKDFLRHIEKLEVMEFIEDSEGDAIRIFQTVNDRGKPLSNMEKAKSLLVYFSNRYLGKKLDAKINDIFGEIFEIYDDIKNKGEHLGINLIKNKEFNEDNIMRYHFISFDDENYDASASYVLSWLKSELEKLRDSERKNKNYSKIENFISTYTQDLRNFFLALREIIEKADKEVNYYKIFVVLGLSATLYPLVVKLGAIGLLEAKRPGGNLSEYSFLDLIELIEVRVYKTRGTDPRAEISRYAASLSSCPSKRDIQNIQDWLLWFNDRWMTNEEFQANIERDVYGNKALVHIFIDYCEHLSNKAYTISKLKKIMTKDKPTIEHVLSQKPRFSYRSHGFRNKDELLEYEHALGNLTLLEERLNKAAQNKNSTEKVVYYDRSGFKMTKNLSSLISTSGKVKKNVIQERTLEIAKYCKKRWWSIKV